MFKNNKRKLNGNKIIYILITTKVRNKDVYIPDNY